jgi:protein-tyrosine-phosphatase
MRAATTVFLALIAAIFASSGIGQDAAPPQLEPAASVVFVCQHGNVKSLIAASLFEQAARKRGLRFRAVSRGVNPEAGVPPSIVDALRGDGVEVAGFEPQPLTPDDISTASHVIALGVDLSESIRGEQVTTERWNDVPPASVDYAAARAALMRHIDVLLDQLQQHP